MTDYLFPMPGSNMTGMISLVSHANNLTEGWFGTGILITIAIISLMVTRNFSFEKGFAFTSFICFLISLLFFYMGIVNQQVFYICGIALVGASVLLFISKDNQQA